MWYVRRYKSLKAPIRRNHDAHHRRIKRFLSKPLDFGGSNLKTDPTLKLTANPMTDLQVRQF